MSDGTNKPGKRTTYRTRCFCFTSFSRDRPVWKPDSMSYITFQQERSPTTGKLHFQGYVEYLNKVSFEMAAGLLTGDDGMRPHIESRKGTQQQAIDYCKKSKSAIEGTHIECGRPIRQGERNDLNSMLDMIEIGYTVWETVREHEGNGLRHIGMIEKACQARWQVLPIDNYIIKLREQIPKLDPHTLCPEVAGNTSQPLNDD